MRTSSVGLVLRLGADIEPQIFELDDLLAFLVGQQVNRLAADDAGSGPRLGPDRHPLADQLLRHPSRRSSGHR